MSGCPSTSLEVKTSSERLNCVQPEVYHCLRDQVGKKTEKCIKPSWIQRGLCAEYNTIAERLDAKGCQLSRGLCPDKAYLSNDVISFSGCAPNEIEITTKNTTSSNNIPFESDGEGIPTGTIIAIGCIAVFCMIALGVAILVCFCRRRLGNTNEDAENKVPLIENKEEKEKNQYLQKEEEHIRFFAYKGESPKHLIRRTKEYLESKNNVLIIGKPGSGKTTLAWALCKQMHGESFEGQRWYVKASTSTKDLPDREEMTLILLLDGRFENAWTTEETVNNLFVKLDKLKNKVPSKQMLTIATMSHEAYQRISEYSCIEKLKPMEIIDLDSKLNTLTIAEMTTVLETYDISVRNIKGAKEIKVLSQRQLQAIYDCFNYHKKFWRREDKIPKIGFPLIASLMTPNSHLIGNMDFVRDTIKDVFESIKRLRESAEVTDKNKYCTIVYASFNWGFVDTDNVDHDLLTKIGQQHGHQGAEIDPDFYVLRKRTATLNRGYVDKENIDETSLTKMGEQHDNQGTEIGSDVYDLRKKTDTVYEFLNESLLRAFFAAYGSKHLAFVIVHCPLQVLLEYSVSNRENIPRKERKFFLIIGGIEYEKALIRRIRDENVHIRHHRIWEQNGFQEVYKNIYAKGDVSNENIK